MNILQEQSCSEQLDRCPGALNEARGGQAGKDQQDDDKKKYMLTYLAARHVTMGLRERKEKDRRRPLQRNGRRRQGGIERRFETSV